ncbi:MAG TPA: hypothetical protein VFY22_02820, partial [Hydrogenophaga sp.]|nr:hypothetical protein [Hydrogenophaga sp.]
EIVTLIADAERRALNLQAKWWLSDTGPNAAPPVIGGTDLNVDLADRSVDALAAAHRMALWQLAMRIV